MRAGISTMVNKTPCLTREQKGQLIFEAGKVDPLDASGNRYFVNSQSNNEKGYVVLYDIQSCECDDYVRRRQPCKHFFACRAFKVDMITKIVEKLGLAKETVKEAIEVFNP